MAWTYTRGLMKDAGMIPNKPPVKKTRKPPSKPNQTTQRSTPTKLPNPIASPMTKPNPAVKKPAPVRTLSSPTVSSESIPTDKRPNPALAKFSTSSPTQSTSTSSIPKPVLINTSDQGKSNQIKEKPTTKEKTASTSVKQKNAVVPDTQKEALVATDPEVEKPTLNVKESKDKSDSSENQVTKKRGRPPKKSTNTDRPQAVVAITAPVETETITPKVEKRGRPRKETSTKSKKESNSVPSQGARTLRSKKAETASSEQSEEPTKENPKRTSQKRSNNEDAPEKPTKVRRGRKNLAILDDTFKLKVVIKGHTETNIPARIDGEYEDSKDLWSCAFEPNKNDIVAICGSYTVLFLDTDQGRYVKKYTHSEMQEIFYSMAWTTLAGEELLNDSITQDDGSCNILAVAGRLGSIKLLNPLQNECYRYLFGHRKAVLALSFSKTNPRWLFSASADNLVRLWDIGSPTSKTDDSICLAMFVLPDNVGEPCALSISYDSSTLIVGCTTGDIIKFNITAATIDKLNLKAQEYREKIHSSEDKSTESSSIDTIKQNYIYPHGDEWHEGYVDDVCILGQDGNKKSPLNNHIVSRGADDMEIIIWDPAKSKKTDAVIDKALEWPDSANCTGLKFKVIESEEQKVLVAGDYEGQIRIYNIGDGVKSKTLKDNSKQQFPPAKILSHKMSGELIRDVCCSNDTHTIVAVDNSNTVFIWTTVSI